MQTILESQPFSGAYLVLSHVISVEQLKEVESSKTENFKFIDSAEQMVIRGNLLGILCHCHCIYFSRKPTSFGNNQIDELHDETLHYIQLQLPHTCNIGIKIWGAKCVQCGYYLAAGIQEEMLIFLSKAFTHLQIAPKHIS